LYVERDGVPPPFSRHGSRLDGGVVRSDQTIIRSEGIVANVEKNGSGSRADSAK
jgi:hypothetical protein